MTSLERIQAKIKELYQTNPKIHIDATLKTPRIVLTNASAKIVGVYPHTFQIEEDRTGVSKRHTLQYTDILIGQIVISEIKW